MMIIDADPITSHGPEVVIGKSHAVGMITIAVDHLNNGRAGIELDLSDSSEFESHPIQTK